MPLASNRYTDSKTDNENQVNHTGSDLSETHHRVTSKILAVLDTKHSTANRTKGKQSTINTNHEYTLCLLTTGQKQLGPSFFGVEHFRKPAVTSTEWKDMYLL